LCQYKIAWRQAIAKFHFSADDKPRWFTSRKKLHYKRHKTHKELEVHFVIFALFAVRISSFVSLQKGKL